VNPQTGEYTASSRTPTGIPTDPPLTAYGVEQANELAEHLCNIDPPIDRVYSSPFYRCLETLKPTTERLFAQGKAGGKIRVDRGLGEFYGKADFSHPAPPDIAALESFFNNLDKSHVSIHIPHEKGEFIQEMHDRVERALESIITALDNDPEQPKTLLICTHAAAMIAMGRILTGRTPDDLDDDDFQCYTASLSTFKRKSERKGSVAGGWDCVGNAETHFLSHGAERGWYVLFAIFLQGLLGGYSRCQFETQHFPGCEES
jgi:transcription factor C subunit 7